MFATHQHFLFCLLPYSDDYCTCDEEESQAEDAEDAETKETDEKYNF